MPIPMLNQRFLLSAFILLLISVLLLTFTPTPSSAKGPKNKEFGFGITLGEPTGLGVKYWMDRETALVGVIGGSFFGSPHIGADYLWHFDAFNSSIVKMYAGPGLVLGFGSRSSGVVFYKNRGRGFYYRDSDSFGMAVRMMFGLNIIPRRAPLEFFLEVGPLVGVVPDFGAAFTGALGARFYP